MNEIIKEGRELSYIEILINSSIIIFKYLFPNFFKFITCSYNEYRFCRKLLSFIIGTLYGLVIYYLTINSLDQLSEITKQCLAIFIITIISIGMAFIPNVRCVMTLATFNFVSSAAKIMLTSYIFVNLLNGPIENTLKNTNELTKSVTCQLNTFRNLTNNNQLKFNHQREMIEDMDKTEIDLNHNRNHVNSLINDIKNELIIKKEKKRYFDDSEYDFSIGNELITNASNDNKSRQEEFYQENKKNCEENFQNSYDICSNEEKKVNERIKELDWNSGIFVNEMESSPCDKNLIQICKNQIKQNDYNGLDKDLDNLDISETLIKSSNFDPNLEYEFNMKDNSLTSKEKIVNANEKMNDVEGYIKYYSTHVRAFMKGLKILANFGFSIVFLNSYKYYNKYMNDIRFDNFIITQYFRKIDARRFKSNKRNLLPLRSFEKKNLFYPYQYYVSAYQKFNLRKNIFINKCLIVFIFFSLFIDFILYDFMIILRMNSPVELYQKSYNKVEWNVKGNGSLASLIRKQVKYLNKEKITDILIDTEACLPNVQKLDVEKIFELVYQVGLLMLLIVVEIYVKRFNRIICAYFNRKREKSRIIWLYNLSIKKRINFLKNAKDKVMFKKKNNLLEMDSFLKKFLINILKSIEPINQIMDFLGFGVKYCILCDLKERSNSVKCEVCSIVFCLECWKDLDERCIGCSDATNYETSFEYY
jgi:hypothetical protein